MHSYEPTPKDIIAIRNADVFVYVGGESDAWVKTVLEGVDNPNLRVVTLMDCVELLDEETVEGMQTEKHDHEADGTEPDEHVWTSPRNAARICQKLSDTFAAADSAHAAAYAQRCGDYVEKLDQLDAEFQDVVAHAARKTMVLQTVSHCGILPRPMVWTIMPPIPVARMRPSHRRPRWRF